MRRFHLLVRGLLAVEKGPIPGGQASRLRLFQFACRWLPGKLLLHCLSIRQGLDDEITRALNGVGGLRRLVVASWCDSENMQMVHVAVEYSRNGIEVIRVIPEHLTDGFRGQQARKVCDGR